MGWVPKVLVVPLLCALTAIEATARGGSGHSTSIGDATLSLVVVGALIVGCFYGFRAVSRIGRVVLLVLLPTWPWTTCRQRLRFLTVLRSRVKRSQWETVSGVTDEQFRTLVRRSVSLGFLQMRNGEAWRTARVRF
jgi:hypothetical protein